MAFADEVRALAVASRELHAAAVALRGMGGGGGSGTGVGGGIALGGRGAIGAAGAAGIGLAAAGALADGVSAGARFLTPAASAFASTGTSQGVASAVTQSLIGAVGSTGIGGFLLGASGLTQANDNAQRAGARVGAVTEDLARYGVEISDEFRQRLFDVASKQETAVGTERAKVAELSGSAKAIEQNAPAGAGELFREMLSVLKSIESTVKSRVGGRT